jgi:hypothetical protein
MAYPAPPIRPSIPPHAAPSRPGGEHLGLVTHRPRKTGLVAHAPRKKSPTVGCGAPCPALAGVMGPASQAEGDPDSVGGNRGPSSGLRAGVRGRDRGGEAVA